MVASERFLKVQVGKDGSCCGGDDSSVAEVEEGPEDRS